MDGRVEELIGQLRHEEPEVRLNAVLELVEIGDASAVPALIKARLRDEDMSVRDMSTEALGKIGDASAVPALIVALGDADEAVRGYAAEMIRGEYALGSHDDLRLLVSAAREARRAGRPTAEFVGLYHKWFEILSERAGEKSEVKKMRAPSRPKTPGGTQRMLTARGAGR